MPCHLELDKSKLSAKVTARCEREWAAQEINELLVVEYYSRKVRLSDSHRLQFLICPSIIPRLQGEGFFLLAGRCI